MNYTKTMPSTLHFETYAAAPGILTQTKPKFVYVPVLTSKGPVFFTEGTLCTQQKFKIILFVLLQIIDNKEFHSLILEDAASVRERQETDSIPVVDDIRFHLMRRVLPYYVSDEEDEVFVDCEGNLQILDNLLVYLGIEC